LSKIIDLCNEVLNFAQKEAESLGAAWSRYNQLAFSGPELPILYAIFMQHFVHGLGTESTKYLDMTSGGVFVHCTVEEGKLILDRILSVTPLEDLQFKAPVISKDEPVITYLDTSDISALPA
jgi:predicted phage-related endonuclease